MTKELNTQNMTADELTALAADLDWRAVEMRKADRLAKLNAQRAKEAAENRKHYDEMFAEIGQPVAGLNEKQHDIVYSQACQQGHSSGYGEVEGHYGELAEMVRRILDAA